MKSTIILFAFVAAICISALVYKGKQQQKLDYWLGKIEIWQDTNVVCAPGYGLYIVKQPYGAKDLQFMTLKEAREYRTNRAVEMFKSINIPPKHRIE